MSGEFCRFLHASDLHLELPLYGFSEIPGHLRDQLIDAPLQAAAHVFETAILEDVDFVILSGDIIDPRTSGPQALAFLLEQFELLREQKIHVYWAGGQDDPPEAWPDEVPLPDHVHVFPKGQVKQIAHRRGETPVAQIVGLSSSGDGMVEAGNFRTDPANIFTVAAAHGQADSGSLAAHKHIDYWALGGLHDSKTLFQAKQTGHYPGSPQGRCPQEDGLHGCTLVHVDHGRKVRTKKIATDVVRWRAESIDLGENSHRNELQRQLRSGMQRIASEASGCTVLVSWTVDATGPLVRSLRNGDLARELTEWLRTEFGRAEPAVWTTALRVGSTEPVPEELYEEDTILGDFLRAVQEHERNRAQPLNLASFVPDMGNDRSLAASLQTVDSSARRDLLAEAALLGVDLLSGEETL
jgi:DNA repair exonuclease SbcCD nuclease subunit